MERQIEDPLYEMRQGDSIKCSINATAVNTIVEADNEIDPNPYNLSQSTPGDMKCRSWTEVVNKRDRSIKSAANLPRSVNRHDKGIPVNLNMPQQYSKYVNNLDEKSDEVKLRELLNVNTPCVPEYKSKSMESICMFIRKGYHILHLNVNDKKIELNLNTL